MAWTPPLRRPRRRDLAERVTIERLLCEAATASSIDTDLYRAIESGADERYPGARRAILFPGGSDLRVARRLGGIRYSFERDVVQAWGRPYFHAAARTTTYIAWWTCVRRGGPPRCDHHGLCDA